MALAAGQVIATSSYISLQTTVVAMCYAGQSPVTVQTYVATQQALIQAQLVASGHVITSVIGVVIGTDIVPAVGVIT